MPDDSQTDARAASRRVALVVAVALAVLAADQLTKVWALAALDDGTRRPLVGDLLGLHLTRNAGAALSLGTGMTWVLTLVAAVVAVVVVRTARRTASAAWAVTFGLLLGGALGNLGDRLLRSPGPLRGHVVDFIAYGNWFIGNVADIAIVVAAGLVMVFVAIGLRLDGTREDHRTAPRDDG
ncbi:MAG: signal peptidase II [Micrococcales bacterium]|nr:signal peptidase II [Micrococcales bacterium]MCL2667377.1 signal peptidase II [Micrococcales bacterium]